MMNRVKVTVILGILASPLAVPITLSIASGQETAGGTHEHLVGVACDDVPPGEKRPDFGCFNVGRRPAVPEAAGVLAHSDFCKPCRSRRSQERNRDRR